jgi:hypothetical protein
MGFRNHRVLGVVGSLGFVFGTMLAIPAVRSWPRGKTGKGLGVSLIPRRPTG